MLRLKQLESKILQVGFKTLHPTASAKARVRALMTTGDRSNRSLNCRFAFCGIQSKAKLRMSSHGASIQSR
jgi:hypothetical protein